MKKYTYPNACLMKLKNRRVITERIEEKRIGIIFKTTCETIKETGHSAHHEVIRGKVKITSLAISSEAAFALYCALGSVLRISDVPKEHLILE